MSLLDLHEDDLINAAEAAPPVAPRKQDPAFSAWGVVKGAVKAVPAGVSEVAASAVDVMSGLSKVDVSAKAMAESQTDEGRKKVQKQAQQTLETGFRSDVGRSFRNVAKDYMPDAQTAHGAEVAVAEFSRLATKAILGGVTMGPVAGAIVAGAEEGFTASEKLAEQGVDVATRSKVGAVTGAVTAAGFALPVAGKTWAQTIGLAVAGGPASFIGQNAATREILQSANYDKLADQYDPLDPVGLTLSTLIPLGFGAAAMRGAARNAASAADVKAAPPEVVDAARVQLLREVTDAHRATPPEDFAAAQAHDAAVDQALDQMATGQRVEVPPLPEAAGTQVTQAMADRMAPVAQEIEALRPPEPVQVAPVAAQAVEAPAQPVAQPARFDIDAIAREASDFLSDGRSPAEILGRMETEGRTVAPELQNMIVGLSEFGRRMPELLDQFRALETQNQGAPVQNLIADAIERMRAGQPVGTAPARSPLETRLEAEIVGNPAALETKLPTAFDADGKVTDSVTAREFLDTIKAEADQEAADADLLLVAANCFLMNGN